MVSIAFQETLSLPLTYASVLGDSNVVTEADFTTKAKSYVLIYTVFISIYKWIFGYRLLKNTERPGPEIQLLESSSYPDLENTNTESLITKIKHIMNPPIYASIIGIILALIPYMKQFVISESGAILRLNVFLAIENIGKATTPLICLILGSNLSEGYPRSADIS